VRANTRREYRRLLVNFALTYFDRESGCAISIAPPCSSSWIG